MSSITSSHVNIQTSPQSVPSTPSWMGEVAVVAHYLIHLGLLEKIVQEVRFSRKRFGTYETIDFICVLIGYALSGEATLKGFYEPLTPFATPFMMLFGRSELPSRAALSRYLSALDQPAVDGSLLAGLAGARQAGEEVRPVGHSLTVEPGIELVQDVLLGPVPLRLVPGGAVSSIPLPGPLMAAVHVVHRGGSSRHPGRVPEGRPATGA